MRGFHAIWAWVAVVSNGLVGLWGLGLAIAKRSVGRAFRVGWAVAYAAMGVQIAAGLVLWARGERPGNDFHVFYGIVIVATFSFGYVYRSQMERRPALAYGLLMLFVMGLGIRAWANVS